MLTTSKGIVLQSIKYGENSLISHVLSEEKGLISLISSNRKSKKNKQGNFFQPLSAIQFVYYVSSKSNIHRVKELSYNNKIALPSDDISINAIRFFVAEFLSKVIKEEEQNFSLYHYIEAKVQELNSQKSAPPYFHISFLIELMDILGIQPNLEEGALYFDLEEGECCAQKPTHPNFYDQKEIELYTIGELNPWQLKKTERNKLLNMVLNYYSVQLGGLPNIKSKAVLEVIFE